MKKFFCFFLIIGFFFLCFAQPVNELERFLSKQEGVEYTKVSDYPLKYELKIRQSIDWKNKTQGYFFQKVILTHTGFNDPVIMEIQGYQMYDRKNELQQILNSNDINIEHRYFGTSVPDSSNFNWKYLNLYNVAHDLHHINRIFKEIYKNKWISTGISKGGQTVIYYRYFFPEDVDVSVPYVAPINYTLEDKRVYRFLENVGSEDCRDKIFHFQEFMLKNEKEILPYIEEYSNKRKITYQYVGGFEKAYELTVLEFSFSFWQWGYPCEKVPEKPSVEEAINYLLKVCNISFFGDGEIKNMYPHYYQAATEMGYYGYDIEPFKKYIQQYQRNPSATFPPKTEKIKYSPWLNKKLKRWLHKKADNIIYIYGELDTWSATRVVPSSKTNSIILEMPGVFHGTARIKNMSEGLRRKFSKTLYDWIQIKPDFSKINE